MEINYPSPPPEERRRVIQSQRLGCFLRPSVGWLWPASLISHAPTTRPTFTSFCIVYISCGSSVCLLLWNASENMYIRESTDKLYVYCLLLLELQWCDEFLSFYGGERMRWGCELLFLWDAVILSRWAPADGIFNKRYELPSQLPHLTFHHREWEIVAEGWKNEKSCKNDKTQPWLRKIW